MLIMNLRFINFIVLLVVAFVAGLQPGDRVSMLTQTLHSDAKTEWIDVPVHMMPRFGEADSHIFHATIPRIAENASEFRINPRSDLKVSFTFLGNKLSVPALTVYSSKDRVSLKKLEIIFTRDEFEVVRVDVRKTYSAKIAKVDPSHPALRGFELQYRWENVQEEDFGLGVQVMFCSCLVAVTVLFLVVVCNSDLMETVQASSKAGGSRGGGGYSSQRNKARMR